MCDGESLLTAKVRNALVEEFTSAIEHGRHIDGESLMGVVRDGIDRSILIRARAEHTIGADGRIEHSRVLWRCGRV